MRKLLALGICVVMAGPAMADIAISIDDFTCTQAGSPYVWGETLLAPGEMVYGLNFVGDWTGEDYAYSMEFEIYVNPPSNQSFDWDPVTPYGSGADPWSFDATEDPIWPTGTGSEGYWSFAFDTSYGIAHLANVTMTLLTTAPVQPDPPDSTLVGVPSETDGNMGDGEVHWYSFTIAETLEMDINTSLTETNFPETGIQDTEIGLYDDWGVRIDYDDDGGEGLLSQMDPTLDAGTYYIAVAGYNSSFGMSGFDVTGGQQLGDYTLQVTPEPASLVLLALGGLAALRRRR